MALAVLLVALFVIAVGVRRGDRGDPTGDHALIDWLGRAGGERATVDPATVTADCAASGGAHTFIGDCTLRVADPGGLKMLILRSTGSFVVSAPAPGGADFTVSDEVRPTAGAEAVTKIAVDRFTEVVLLCPEGARCTVAVATS